MKSQRKIKYAALLGCLALGTTLTSCTDWLTLYPMDKIVEENFWEDKRDLESVRNAAYVNMVSDACMQRYMVWGELRSGNFKNNTTLENGDVKDVLQLKLKPSNGFANWSSFYATINYCNKVLEHGPEMLKKDLSFSESDWIAMRAEMVALRALNYFYLLRTFDEVPMVFKAINDDDEVKALPATSQEVLMDSLVNQLEYVVKTNPENIPTNYGNVLDSRGLITRQAVHTILADIYLWRGSYYHATDKAKADSNYVACNNHCQVVIDLMKEEAKKGNFGSSSSHPSVSEEDNPYYLCVNVGVDGNGLTESAYDEIFGRKNSNESIFELQFDGVVNKNSLVPTFYRDADNPGKFLPSKVITPLSSTPDDASNAALFSKTDLRRWATIQETGKDAYAIVKFAATTIDQKALKDNGNLANNREPIYSLRTVQSANWIFYRLTDVLLMKAEAMCMLGTDIPGAFQLVKAVNDRSNPYATPEEELPESSGNTQELLEKLILRERNREFYGEGKRWFDLMRYAMRNGYDNGPSKAYEIFGLGFEGETESSIRNKYKQNMKVMYFPYAESEVKANPLLVQNPLWNDQNTIQKK